MCLKPGVAVCLIQTMPDAGLKNPNPLNPPVTACDVLGGLGPKPAPPSLPLPLQPKDVIDRNMKKASEKGVGDYAEVR